MLVPGGGDDGLHAQLISKYWSYFSSVPTESANSVRNVSRAECTRARLNPLSEKQYYSLVTLRHHSQVRFVTFPLSGQSFLQLEHDINMDIINKYRQFVKLRKRSTALPTSLGLVGIFSKLVKLFKSLGELFPIFSPPMVIANQ